MKVRVHFPLLPHAKRTTVFSIHVGVRVAHVVGVRQAKPAVVHMAPRALNVEAAINLHTRSVAARAKLAADVFEISVQSFIVRVAAASALFASLAKVKLRLASCAVDRKAGGADDLVHSFRCSDVLVAIWSSAADEIVRVLLAVRSDGIFEKGAISDRRKVFFKPANR